MANLVSTECYRAGPESQPLWPARDLSLRIGSANTFGTVTPADVLAFGGELGINRRAAERALGEMTEAIGAAPDTILAQFEAKELPAAVRAGELRVL